MIHKRFGNHDIKFYNDELQRLFTFKSGQCNGSEANEGNSTPRTAINKKRENNEDVFDDDHLNNIMTKKFLLPISKLNESEQNIID